MYFQGSKHTAVALAHERSQREDQQRQSFDGTGCGRNVQTKWAQSSAHLSLQILLHLHNELHTLAGLQSWGCSIAGSVHLPAARGRGLTSRLHQPLAVAAQGPCGCRTAKPGWKLIPLPDGGEGGGSEKKESRSPARSSRTQPLASGKPQLSAQHSAKLRKPHLIFSRLKLAPLGMHPAATCFLVELP